ncbi:unnamed protein product [Lactuca saligna]|uniref:Uncharacterized protein n=1 Tax=Lactuca saligna TaxID=75948 RepID=A0AA36EJJ7_LACSI|nr:unnamed protein product [Lactuca saligna]
MGWHAFSCFPFISISSQFLLTSVRLISFLIALQNMEYRHTDCHFTTSFLPNNKIRPDGPDSGACVVYFVGFAKRRFEKESRSCHLCCKEAIIGMSKQELIHYAAKYGVLGRFGQTPPMLLCGERNKKIGHGSGGEHWRKLHKIAPLMVGCRREGIESLAHFTISIFANKVYVDYMSSSDNKELDQIFT